jgi:signal recognition particle subunit SRP54
MAEAKRLGRDVVILDTAGRLAIDAELMEQVRQISEVTQPHYTFLVIDAMTGQDAVNTAEAFHETLALDGVILTKLDGDARGGAALSVKEVVGRPIAFASTGEKLKDFDLFHPDRLAGRILGMGDVLTLIEKAEEVYEKEEAEEAATKLLGGQFTLEDFLDQMQQVKKMGPLSGLVKMLPGVPKELRDQEIDDRELAKVEAMITSMTLEERRRPDLIDASRRGRIAKGSGTQPQDVAQLLTQFTEMQKLMKRMGGFGTKKVKKGRKDKKGKGGRTAPGGGRAGGGGRVTPRGGGKVSHGRVTPKGPAPLTLPDLDTGGLPDDRLGDLAGIDLEALGLDPDALGLDPRDLPKRH